MIPYDSVADAVARANGTEFGLCASVWGDDAGQLADVAARLEAGTVFINKHAEIAPHVPLAGTKSSGLGAAFGLEGLKGCTAIKVISARHDSDRAA